MIKRIDGCKNNSEKSSTTKAGEHISCGFLMSLIPTFDGMEKKLGGYWGEDHMKKFCQSLRKHTMKTINFEWRKWYH